MSDTLRDQRVELHADDPPLILGRGDGAGFPVEDARVSRRHARLEWTAGQCVLVVTSRTMPPR